MTRTAGVRISSDQIVWVNAGKREVAPLDEVTTGSSEGEVTGIVVISPEQLLNSEQPVDGKIEHLRRKLDRNQECLDLPGSDMPYLGSHAGINGAEGIVVATNAVSRMITARLEDGTVIELPASDLGT